MPCSRTSAALVGLCASTLLLAGCERNEYVAPPPPKVTVAKPVSQPVTRYLEATGSTAAVNSADLVARVPGFVDQISYEDGALVKKGTLLFTIEPGPYELKEQQAKAAQTGAEASLKQAQAAYDRQKDLLSRQVSTQAQYDQALATRDSAQSTLDQAKVNTQLATINNDYAHVKAPFDGVVTARQVSVGEYVGGTATPTVLATIVQVDPIYVNFSISEQDVLRVREMMAKRGITPEDLRTAVVEIGLQNETGYPHRGHLDYAAPTVTQSTGTLQVRGVLDNKDRVLLPGYFVRVRVPSLSQEPALLIPEVAIGADQGGRYVLVVNADNVVEQRKVEIGQRMDALRVIDKGLTPDDRVVIAGILRAIPGQKVDPQMQTASAAQ
jgi:RND family efflux transporter MFP subunit